jgi:hypothetical protein
MGQPSAGLSAVVAIVQLALEAFEASLMIFGDAVLSMLSPQADDDRGAAVIDYIECIIRLSRGCPSRSR